MILVVAISINHGTTDPAFQLTAKLAITTISVLLFAILLSAGNAVRRNGTAGNGGPTITAPETGQSAWFSGKNAFTRSTYKRR